MLVPGFSHRAWALVHAPPRVWDCQAGHGAAPGAPNAPACSDQGAWGPSDALDDLSAEAAEADPGDTGLPPEQSATATLPQETALPAQYLQLIDGKPFVKYAGLLTMAHAQGLQQLEAWFTGVSDTLAVAHATATFRDGRRFSESGEATPENVGRRAAALCPLGAHQGQGPLSPGCPQYCPMCGRGVGGEPADGVLRRPLGPGSGWERERASLDEARTPAIQHTHGFSAMRGTAALASKPDVESTPGTPATHVVPSLRRRPAVDAEGAHQGISCLPSTRP